MPPPRAILQAGFVPWGHYLAMLTIWILSAYVLATPPTLMAQGLGVIEGLVFVFFLFALSERFWRRYLLRPFVVEQWWLRSWIYWGLAALVFAGAFRFAVHDMENASPGGPLIAFLDPVSLFVTFFLGGWNSNMIAFRVLLLAALFIGLWACYVNDQSRRNFYMEHLHSLMRKNMEEKMKADVEKRSFGSHRNLFEDN